jgi:DNA-binding NtrC family response regulator
MLATPTPSKSEIRLSHDPIEDRLPRPEHQRGLMMREAPTERWPRLTEVPERAYLTSPTPNSAMGVNSLEISGFLSMGRDPDMGLRLDSDSVSLRHCRIERRDSSGWFLRDLQSTNGTYLNGSRVSEARLKDHDFIQVGEFSFYFTEQPWRALELSSKSPIWEAELRRLPQFAKTDFSVLLVGPSGSGKEILAEAIHRHSTRAKMPFVAINCSALSESLIESELFGHLRGSYTGATHDRKGAFEAARGGTLFLDEIGDLPLSLQPKLLRALEAKEIRPVGSDRCIKTDVRIIAATHKNLIHLVKLGHFREDLYWRLNVCSMSPPALRDRMEDFTDLVYQLCRSYRVRLSHNAIERLREHSWPGNIRELRSVIQRAAAYYPGQNIQPEDLANIMEPRLYPEVMPLADSVNPHAQYLSGSSSTPPGVGQNVIREIEREMIIRRLTANRGNQRKTAQDLGLPKSTLHDRLRTYGIDPNQFKI